MKAVIMNAPGSPEVLQMQAVPEPKLESPHQILVKLKAAGVNPIDTKLRKRGTFYPQQLPTILGCDGAGVVVAIGEQVSEFKPQDEVYFYAGGLGKSQTGNYAEYVVVEDHLVAHKPQSISFAEAAAAPLVLITAWESLYDRARLKNGDKVLIQAGAGGVGHVAIQLAKLQGAQVATTVSSLDKERLVRQFGADYPILYSQTDVKAAITDWTEGNGVDIGFDTVGGKTFFTTCESVRVYGDVVTILEPNCALGNWKTARDRNLRISLELMLTPALKEMRSAQAAQTAILKQCATWIDQGKLKIHLSQTFLLEQVNLAHQVIETGSSTGKIALLID